MHVNVVYNLGGRFSVFLGKGGSGLYLLPCYINIIRLHLHQNWECGEKASIHFQLVLCIFAAADFQSSRHPRRMYASWVKEVHISSNFWLLQCSLGLGLPPHILYGLYSLVVTPCFVSLSILTVSDSAWRSWPHQSRELLCRLHRVRQKPGFPPPWLQ